MNAIVAAFHRLGRIPEAVVLRDPTPPVRRVLAVAGIEHMFTLEMTGPGGVSHDGRSGALR